MAFAHSPRGDHGPDEADNSRAHIASAYHNYVNPTTRAYAALESHDPINLFETRLGLPINVEAALAYLLFPPIGAIILVIFELSSPYVRFHAFQSIFVSLSIAVFHLLFIRSTLFFWVLLLLEAGLFLHLAVLAYKSAVSMDLEQCQIPVIGPHISRYVEADYD